VAQVMSPHGVRGELKCRIVTDFPEKRFRRGTSVIIDGTSHRIQAARIQGGHVLLKLADIADREAAQAYRNKEILVRTEDAVTLPEGQFYWHQVIGLQVEDAITHETLGTVTDIIETGANDVYVVKGARGEILVPAIKDVVKSIEPERQRMLVEPLPGMLR
jgi:16S rRNA processing protein RimM